MRPWAASRAVYTTPDRRTVYPARKGASASRVSGVLSRYSIIGLPAAHADAPS